MTVEIGQPREPGRAGAEDVAEGGARVAEAGAPGIGGGRSIAGRMARLHLRGGLIGLARVELETMAADGTLDREAAADLAEARWRMGDLSGAGEAADAHLATGGDEVIATLVAAEALEVQGRIVEARRYAARVMARVGDRLDELFAGEPRSELWPPPASRWSGRIPSSTGAWGLLVGGREVYETSGTAWHGQLRPRTSDRARRDEPSAPALRWQDQEGARVSEPLLPDQVMPDDARRLGPDGSELDRLARAVERGEGATVAEPLALLLRADPGLASTIASLAEHALSRADLDARQVAALEILRGDAMRSAGSEIDAAAAYQTAADVLRRPHRKESP